MKKMMIWALAILPVFAFAQSEDNGQELIDKFFEQYREKSPSAAVAYAFGTSQGQDMDPADTELNPVTVKLTKTVMRMGKFQGQEEVKNNMIGSRYRIASYLVYYEHEPIGLTFELYKGSKGWEITDLVLNRKFSKELQVPINLAF